MAVISRIAVLERHPVARQPLLRSPFSGAGQIAISALKPGWTGPAHSAARLRNIQDLVIGGGIGGTFWQATPCLPRRRMNAVILPSQLPAAKTLWSNLLLGHSAGSLAVFHPPSRQLTPLLRKITAAGAYLAPLGNPHDVLDIADAAYAAAPADLIALAALAGIPAFELRQGQLHALIPEAISAGIADGTDYANPFSGGPADIEQIAEILADWRRSFRRNRGFAACTGIALWKRRRVRRLLHNGESAPRFHISAKAALQRASRNRGSIAAWTRSCPAMLPAAAQAKNVPLFRLEDGFLRSAGLGSGMVLPASIVADQHGMYFDPAQPSDLEYLLEGTVFSESIRLRASRLVALLNAKAISKYSAGGVCPRLTAKPGQRRILVPGQVGDDRSLKLGATGPINNNLSLLQEVRRRHPDAFIVYRPHPDVSAGHRRGAIPNPVKLGFADQQIDSGAIAALIGKVDEVHTMTSLAGFEALLRGRIVHTFGQPFYAGWGLTTDHLPISRRQRRLQLEELVAGTLILYPRYIDPQTGLPCGPELLIARLQQPELWPTGPLMRLRRMQGACRRMLSRLTERWIGFDA